MDLAEIAALPSRARVVGTILERSGAQVDGLDAASARAMILSMSPAHVQIRLLNRYQSLFSDEDVREILVSLPKPFSEIKRGYGIPMLEKTETNVALATWLDARNIISSWSIGWLGDIRINLFRRDADD